MIRKANAPSRGGKIISLFDQCDELKEIVQKFVVNSQQNNLYINLNINVGGSSKQIKNTS